VEFIFNAFINLEPVQRSEDGCDMRRFRRFKHSTRKTTTTTTVLDLLEAVYREGKSRDRPLLGRF